MDLDELMTGMLETSVVHATKDGDRLVGLRLADDWGVGLRLHRRGTHRQWNVREITLRPLATQSSISSNDVRELPLGALIAEARRLATKNASEDLSPTPRTTLAEVMERNGGTFGSSDDALATLALEYVALVEAGVRTPSKSLVARHGGSAGSWTNRVGHARRRGFLTAVGRGEAGGALTAAAIERLGLRRPTNSAPDRPATTSEPLRPASTSGD